MNWVHRSVKWQLGVAAAVVATIALVAAGCGSSSSGSSAGSGASGLVRAVQNSQLGTPVLVNRQGMTLYALSAERHGKFICTSADVAGTSTPCVSVWRPLTATQGQSLGSGIHNLATVRRPGTSAMQVTYRGMPLYTFADDHSAGQVSGNGLHDVGTWHAVTVAAAATAAAPATSSGGGYGGGY
jgi:predicted lipoprotein with Yx(FWY)xxD motif